MMPRISERGSVYGKFLYVVFIALILPLLMLAAITRTARGVLTSTTTSNTLTLSVTAGTTGSSLVVFTFSDLSTVTISSITWTGGTFTKLGTCSSSSGVIDAEIWRANNVTAGTNNMLVTWSGNTKARSMAVTELNGSNGVLTDGICATAGSGGGTPATTGSMTCTPNAAAQCAWLAIVGVTASSGAITYVRPSSGGQNCGISVTDDCLEGFELDSSTVTQAGNATISGVPSSWVMTMGTLLEPAGGPTVDQIMSSMQQDRTLIKETIGIVSYRSRLSYLRDLLFTKRSQALVQQLAGAHLLRQMVERESLLDQVVLHSMLQA